MTIPPLLPGSPQISEQGTRQMTGKVTVHPRQQTCVSYQFIISSYPQDCGLIALQQSDHEMKGQHKIPPKYVLIGKNGVKQQVFN